MVELAQRPLTPDQPSVQPAGRTDKDEIKRIARCVATSSKDYGASWSQGLAQLLVTCTLFCTALAVMYVTRGIGFWLTLILAAPTAGLLVRLFILQHDCGHGSFLPSRAANDAIGRILGLLTLTPYGAWRRDHAVHHASTSNLDRRGQGDVTTLTSEEYRLSSPVKRIAYRAYRNPFVMVLLGAPINFLVLQRFVVGQSFRDRSAWRSILLLNIALVIAVGAAGTVLGFGATAAIYLPVIVIASWIGNWLFYVQHQFEGTHWDRKEEWDFHVAALRGSSHFEMPAILRWFSGNIGLHHVHHLSSKIPNYRLQACHDAHPDLSRFTRKVGLVETLRCWRLSVWDERQGRLISFREAELAADALA